MKTIKALCLVLAVGMLSSSIASAQSVYNQNWYAGSCINLSRTLSSGMAGADVKQLQTFLVAQNFPGSGTWMQSSYFGAATVAAVKDYQQVIGLPMTGIADPATRAAIASTSCGGMLATPTATTYPTNVTPIPWNQYGTTYQNTYQNNYQSGYQYSTGYVSLNLTSLSQNTGSVGTQVTVYGTGFDATGNTINFGSVALTGVPSNGTSMTFIVPSYVASGSVNISVTDSRGTSNSLSFTVINYGYYCGSGSIYSIGSCGCTGGIYGSAYGTYNSCITPVVNSNLYAPTATYLSPNGGGVGTSVTVFGSGFTSSNNSVRFGNGVIANISSNDGKTLSFTVPSQLTGYGAQNTGLGIYNVSVTNGNGYATNVLPFTVTALGTTGAAPAITNVNGPSSIAAGTVGTWTVTVNNPSNAAVTVTPNWGDGASYLYNNAIAPQTSYAAGSVTLTFTHVYSTSGTYALSFTVSNSNGTVTSASQNVVVTGSTVVGTGVPTISYLSPNAARVGSSVTIYGSNFASTDTIMFGGGALQNVYSNGSSITFTVPSSVGPYCAANVACPQYAILVTPGVYNISVMDSYGTSNTLQFTVQQ